jgi:hypothetical protein
MAFRNAAAPAADWTANRGREPEQLGRRLAFSNSKRSPRRQHLARHLHACGPRPVLEALLEVEAGRPLDVVLADFARLPAELYRATSADVLPIDEIVVIEGGPSRPLSKPSECPKWLKRTNGHFGQGFARHDEKGGQSIRDMQKASRSVDCVSPSACWLTSVAPRGCDRSR